MAIRITSVPSYLFFLRFSFFAVLSLSFLAFLSLLSAWLFLASKRFFLSLHLFAFLCFSLLFCLHEECGHQVGM